MSYYKKHVFFCTNQTADGKKCCAQAEAAGLRAYAKQQMKLKKLSRPGGVRVNIAGCLGRCAEGPTIVVYPEGVWYAYQNQKDIDEIIEQHLVNGRIVERLLMDKPS